MVEMDSGGMPIHDCIVEEYMPLGLYSVILLYTLLAHYLHCKPNGVSLEAVA
jgi:hypothetical protein